MSNERGTGATPGSDVSGAGGHRLPQSGLVSAIGRRAGGDPTTELPAAYEALGPYRLIAQVGEGGMGVVHKAIDRQGHEVAIKVLRAHIAHDSGARERLRREVSTLSRVRSASVAEVLDADVDGDRPYLVTRYVPGPPLDAVIDEHGPLGPDRLVHLGRGLAMALRAIHAAGIVHRDVKPGNVLMDGEDPVLIDFGIAHVADDVRLTMTGLVMGTPGYLSPEIVEGAPVAEATDWWGWAATLAFAASGQAPFGRGPMQVVLDRVTRGQADLSGVDERMRPLLAAALSPHPQDRPTADQVLEQLQVYAGGGHTGMMPVRPATKRIPGRAAAPAAAPPVGNTTVQPRRAPDPTEQLSSAAPVDPYAGGAGQAYPGAAAYGPSGGPAVRPQASPMAASRNDPRIGQPARTWTLAALAAAAVGLCALWPLIGVALIVLWSFAARWADKAMTSMVLRRFGAGPRRSDSFIAVISSPWHGILAAASTVLTALIPLFVGVCTTVTVALGFAMTEGGDAQLNRPVPIAAGVLVAVWMLWWGPGGASMRRGSRSMVRGGVRGEQLTRVICGLLGVIAVGALLWSLVHLHTPVSWWPFGSANQVPLNDYVPSLPGR
ncbi:serine/threonine-protein kinase [Leekyejoonella antrihumi]|nr:serine/threonine-protein kinase [Leekyejoonella antrihumi]